LTTEVNTSNGNAGLNQIEYILSVTSLNHDWRTVRRMYVCCVWWTL